MCMSNCRAISPKRAKRGWLISGIDFSRASDYRQAIRGDVELWGVDKANASIVSQIGCIDGGRWPVQPEFSRRMKRRFQESGIAFAGQTIPMQIPAPADVASNLMPRRTAGWSRITAS
jgi:moderate conductance mechanosensitive channel